MNIRYICRKISILFLLFFLFTTVKASAASYQAVSEKTKVGDNYFWAENNKIMVSETEDGAGECIVENSEEKFLTDGENIYYFSIPNYEKDFTNLYLVKADGTGKKHIKKLKHYICFSGFYGNEIFYQRHRSYHNAEKDNSKKDKGIRNYKNRDRLCNLQGL